LTLFVQGTQPQAEISYEIDDTEVVVGSDVVLPWQATIEVAADRDVRLMAAGVAEIGDLRCQITGDTVPTRLSCTTRIRIRRWNACCAVPDRVVC